MCTVKCRLRAVWKSRFNSEEYCQECRLLQDFLITNRRYGWSVIVNHVTAKKNLKDMEKFWHLPDSLLDDAIQNFLLDYKERAENGEF